MRDVQYANISAISLAFGAMKDIGIFLSEEQFLNIASIFIALIGTKASGMNGNQFCTMIKHTFSISAVAYVPLNIVQIRPFTCCTKMSIWTNNILGFYFHIVNRTELTSLGSNKGIIWIRNASLSSLVAPGMSDTNRVCGCDVALSAYALTYNYIMSLLHVI